MVSIENILKNYALTQHLLILASDFSACVSISAFASSVGIIFRLQMLQLELKFVQFLPELKSISQ